MSDRVSHGMSNWVSNNSLGTMKTIGRVSHGSDSSSESLGLSSASVFSLVWLGYRLVRYLASWTSMITSSYYRSMGNNRGSMDYRGGVVSRGSIDNRSSMYNWGGIGWSSLNNGSIWVDSSSFIGNISNITIISISMVVHMLGTAIRKSNGVRSRDSSCTIRSFISIESSL